MRGYRASSLPALYPVPKTVLCSGACHRVPGPARTPAGAIPQVHPVPRQLSSIRATRTTSIITTIAVTLVALPPVRNLDFNF